MTDAANLIERLLTAAAMIMEDSADIALVKGQTRVDERVAVTWFAGQDIVSLAKAAEIIARRWA